MTQPEDDGGAAHEPPMDRLRDSLFEELAAASQDSEIARLRARVAELEAASTWRLIETAPNEEVFLFFPAQLGRPPLYEMIEIGRSHSYQYRKPTHWMPKPPPPEAAP